MVARIAYDKLKETPQGKIALQKAVTLLQKLKTEGEGAGDQILVESAIYADSIKGNFGDGSPGNFQWDWHTVRHPLTPVDKTAADFPNFHFKTENVENSLKHI